jgi:hypothetical protein
MSWEETKNKPITYENSLSVTKALADKLIAQYGNDLELSGGGAALLNLVQDNPEGLKQITTVGGLRDYLESVVESAINGQLDVGDLNKFKVEFRQAYSLISSLGSLDSYPTLAVANTTPDDARASVVLATSRGTDAPGIFGV